MIQSATRSRILIIAALVFSTIVFAINTFDIVSVFYLISAEFNEDATLLGSISASLVMFLGLKKRTRKKIANMLDPCRCCRCTNCGLRHNHWTHD